MGWKNQGSIVKRKGKIKRGIKFVIPGKKWKIKTHKK